MNKEQIKEKLLMEKNVKLIDTLEFNGKQYAKTLKVLTNTKIGFEYKYYEIIDENIKDIETSKLEKIKKFFETNLGNIVF